MSLETRLRSLDELVSGAIALGYHASRFRTDVTIKATKQAGPGIVLRFGATKIVLLTFSHPIREVTASVAEILQQIEHPVDVEKGVPKIQGEIVSDEVVDAYRYDLDDLLCLTEPTCCAATLYHFALSRLIPAILVDQSISIGRRESCSSQIATVWLQRNLWHLQVQGEHSFRVDDECMFELVFELERLVDLSFDERQEALRHGYGALPVVTGH